MRWLGALLLLAVVAGCMSIDAVVLQHPETGETVLCGPHSGLGSANFAATALIHGGCIVDVKEQGFLRVP